MSSWKSLGTVLCVLPWLLAAEAGAGLPKTEDIQSLQARLDSSRRAVSNPTADLDEAERLDLLHKLTVAQAALARFVSMSNEHARRSGLTPLYAVGAALIADDATGIGAADDPLLPLVGISILVAQFAMIHRPSTPEVEAAWSDVTTRVQQLSDAAQAASRRRKSGCYCYCYKQRVGREPIRRMPNEASCARYCRKEFQGYQCGGEVKWY
ncbi:MAG TPA: hypothetical protein VK447_13990 [Myxococcaceae bacterium]|nr:hypothetical protein [Myxococcaceae bacterium]